MVFRKKNVIWFLKTIIITVFLQLPGSDFLTLQKNHNNCVFFAKKQSPVFLNVEKNHSNDVFYLILKPDPVFFLA